MKTEAIKIRKSVKRSFDAVPTKAMLKQPNLADKFKATVFETFKPRSSDRHNHGKDLSQQINATPTPELDLKRIKHEVFNHVKSGFNDKHIVDSNILYAIKLGARPHKNPYTNYKDLLVANKRTRQAVIDQKTMLQLGKNTLGIASVTYKKQQNTGRKKKSAEHITRNYGIVNPKIRK